MKTMKKFDCVKMKDQAQQRRAQMLRGWSVERRIDFYRQADETLRRLQEQLLQRGAVAGGQEPHPSRE
jgi:hypothetical protein